VVVVTAVKTNTDPKHAQNYTSVCIVGTGTPRVPPPTCLHTRTIDMEGDRTAKLSLGGAVVDGLVLKIKGHEMNLLLKLKFDRQYILKRQRHN
jgi:hypothetical protein